MHVFTNRIPSIYQLSIVVPFLRAVNSYRDKWFTQHLIYTSVATHSFHVEGLSQCIVGECIWLTSVGLLFGCGKVIMLSGGVHVWVV